MSKKIYITALHLMHGGIEMAITSVANALVKRGYDVEILCTYNLGEPAYPLDCRVRVTYLTDVVPNRKTFVDAVRRKDFPAIIREGIYSARVLYLKKKVLKDQFRKIKDGVIISTRNEDSVLLSRCGNHGVKKIAQLHHDHEFDKKLVNDFVNNYGNIDVFTLLTDELQKEVSEMMKNNHRTKCVVMPNFLPDEECLTVDISRQNQAIAVGRLHPVKGFLRLIKLWKPIYEKTGTILKIIGGGDQWDELQKAIADQGMQDSVILTGPMNHDAVMQEMRKSQFYAMSSINEGFGFVIIEAMSQGLPVIAFDVRVGPRYIIKNGESGFLVTEECESDFVDKAVKLLLDSDERERMASLAIERSKYFSEENIMALWEELLLE